MKLQVAALSLVVLGTSAVSAAPYYVGENLTPQNNVTLGFQDTPTKDDAPGRTDSGNIANIELDGAFSVMENTSVRANLPMYFVTKNATAGDSRTAIGNPSIGGTWSMPMTSEDKAWTYGVTLGADVFFPASRKDESTVVAAANPTTDIYKYTTRATSLTPTAGLFVSTDMFSAKTNAGYGYMFIQKKSGAPADQSRNTVTWQTAASWHAMPNLHANVEYNTLLLDSETRFTVGSGSVKKRYTHALTPSLSGNYESILGSAFVNIPLDTPTRDVANVAFGANVGYLF